MKNEGRQIPTFMINENAEIPRLKVVTISMPTPNTA